MSKPKVYRYWASLTERWGHSRFEYSDDMIAFERLSDAEDFMRRALRTTYLTVAPVKFCGERGCDEAHVCSTETRSIDIEQSTAHLDIFEAGDSHCPLYRLMYGPNGGIIRENF